VLDMDSSESSTCGEQEGSAYNVQRAQRRWLARVATKVECHPSELYPRVGFIVTNPARSGERVVTFYNQRGTAEQWIKEGKGAIKWTRPVMPHLRRQRGSPSAPCARLQPRQLHADGGDAEGGGAVVPDQPARAADQDRREGGEPRSIPAFQMAEVAVSRQMFQEILSCIARFCGRRPRQHEGRWRQMRQATTGEARPDERKAARFSASAQSTRGFDFTLSTAFLYTIASAA
jgi:hypothetical protein